ncbi:hypothetical protein D3C81_1927280 [compost metagenome]
MAEQGLPHRREVQAVGEQIPVPHAVAGPVQGQRPALLADAQGFAAALQFGGAPHDQGQGALALAEQDEQQDAEQQAEAGAGQRHGPGGQAGVLQQEAGRGPEGQAVVPGAGAEVAAGV